MNGLKSRRVCEVANNSPECPVPPVAVGSVSVDLGGLWSEQIVVIMVSVIVDL